MKRVLHMAMILAVAAHLALGCCMHHAHASSFPMKISGLMKVAGSPCEHEGHGHQSQTCEHEGEEHGCDEASCVFTRPDSSETSDFFLSLQSLALISCGPVAPTLGGIETTCPVSSYSATSDPLHLLNQVLLI